MRSWKGVNHNIAVSRVLQPHHLKGLVRDLERIVGRRNALVELSDLHLYSYDASLEEGMPCAVAFPSSTDQVSRIVKLASSLGLPFVARGSATNLSGGSILPEPGIVISTSRMNRILEIDIPNRRAVVQPGVFNLDLSVAAAPTGYYYIPDPASQKASTLGGNVGENSGGPRCFKYGVTTNHVLGLELVLPDGQVVRLGGKALGQAGAEFLAGYDLVGLFVGSEGTLGVVTEAVVRLARLPQAVVTLLATFGSIGEAGRAVSNLIKEGMVPATLEIMDNRIIRAVQASIPCGYPEDAEAVLIIEVDGVAAGLERLSQHAVDICRDSGATIVRRARNEEERSQLWAGRRGAFGAVARLAPNYHVCDGVVPRTRLPEAIARVNEIGRKHGLPVANVFHAGDGNLHPLILFDSRDPSQRARVLRAGSQILEACVELGGTITGEHGIGLEKRAEMRFLFSDAELGIMRGVKSSLDPLNLCNPGKIFPRDGSSSTVSSTPEGGSRRQACHDIVQSTLGSGCSSDPSHHPPETPATGHTRMCSSDSQPGEPRANSPACSGSTRAGDDPGCRTVLDGIELGKTSYPATQEEVAELLADALSRNLAVIPRGSGTKLCQGAVLQKADLLVDLRTLDRILDYDPAELVIRFEAGISLRTLQEVLIKSGQFLPVDPPFAARATLGGVVASNSHGPRRHGYGSLRDLLLGVKVALPGGKLLRFGGSVVKNVAGYDLTKLFTGSWGTLGIIVELAMRSMPIPEQASTLVAGFCSLRDTERFVSRLQGTQLCPVAVQVLVQGRHGPSRDDRKTAKGQVDETCIVFTAFEGLSEDVEYQLSEALRLAQMEAATGVEHVTDKETDSRLWQTLSEGGGIGSPPDVASSLNPHRTQGCEATATATAYLPPSGWAPFLGEAAIPGELCFSASVSPGIGVTRIQIDGSGVEPESLRHDLLTASLRLLAGGARGLGGFLVLERAPLELRRSLCRGGAGLRGHEVVRETNPGAGRDLPNEEHGRGNPVKGSAQSDDVAVATLARKLKAVFDPAGIMCPGKLGM